MLKKIYHHDELIHNQMSPDIVVPLILDKIKARSVLDVGCGLGNWLKAFEANGIEDYFGIDGDYLEMSRVKIPSGKFKAVDLRNSWCLNRKFDLIISLEVAEHLPEESADSFVEAMISHGECIVFSAAIPGQGGQNHFNEQWPFYWQKKFERHGYYFHDIFRPLIWNNEKVDWWYKQNIFLIDKKGSGEVILNCIHPECFDFHLKMLSRLNGSVRSGNLGVKESLRIFLRSMRLFFSKRLSR